MKEKLIVLITLLMFTTISGFSQNRRNSNRKVVIVEYTFNNVLPNLML